MKRAAQDDPLPALLVSKGAELTDLGDGAWLALHRRWRPSTPEEFKATWEAHPRDFKVIVIRGKDVKLPRWQQAYGRSYAYSGAVSEAIPLDEPRQALLDLLAEYTDGTLRPNGILCNWYAPPGHYIGKHADDTRQLVPGAPIASLSWGCTRTFVLTPKRAGPGMHGASLRLADGDLVIMGGRCQASHLHELLKFKQGEVQGNRINFTMRCFA